MQWPERNGPFGTEEALRKLMLELNRDAKLAKQFRSGLLGPL